MSLCWTRTQDLFFWAPNLASPLARSSLLPTASPTPGPPRGRLFCAISLLKRDAAACGEGWRGRWLVRRRARWLDGDAGGGCWALWGCTGSKGMTVGCRVCWTEDAGVETRGASSGTRDYCSVSQPTPRGCSVSKHFHPRGGVPVRLRLVKIWEEGLQRRYGVHMRRCRNKFPVQTRGRCRCSCSCTAVSPAQVQREGTWAWPRAAPRARSIPVYCIPAMASTMRCRRLDRDCHILACFQRQYDHARVACRREQVATGEGLGACIGRCILEKTVARFEEARIGQTQTRTWTRVCRGLVVLVLLMQLHV